MADLKTDYKDDVLDTTQNTRRKYQMINNGDGTVSFEDVTEYLQQGDSFGADDINDTNEEVNIINDNLSGLSTTINSMKLRFVEYDITISRKGGWGYWGYVTINHGLGRQARIFPIRCILSTDTNVLGIIAVQDITSTTLSVTINAIQSGTYKCSFLYDYN